MLVIGGAVQPELGANGCGQHHGPEGDAGLAAAAVWSLRLPWARHGGQLRTRFVSLAVALGLHVAAIAMIAIAPPPRPVVELPKVFPVTVALIEAPPTPALQHAVPTAPKPLEADPPQPKPKKQARKPVERKVAKAKPPPEPAPAPAAPTPVPVAAAAATPPAATAVATAAPVIPPDLSAAYRNNPKPAYPSICRRRGEEGKVLLHMRVTEQGAPEEVGVAESSGHERLDEAAKEAVRRWTFVPAQQAGRPVAATIIVPITFRLEGYPKTFEIYRPFPRWGSSLSEPRRSTPTLISSDRPPLHRGTRRLPPLSALSADGGGWGGGQAFQPLTKPRLRLTRLAPTLTLPRFAGEGIPWRLQLIDLARESGLVRAVSLNIFDARI